MAITCAQVQVGPLLEEFVLSVTGGVKMHKKGGLKM